MNIILNKKMFINDDVGELTYVNLSYFLHYNISNLFSVEKAFKKYFYLKIFVFFVI
jgi:hypothetical protein